MSDIRILPEDLSNRIAAGEVVERPASVVKELAENAIDAGADRIIIHVERGGRSLIRVVDNGRGMDSEDALLCLEAHATSKIKTQADLDRILTLGFRGEALPSIASISRFTILTRKPDADAGTKVIVDGGTIIQAESAGCAPGTSMTVSNIFFNTPARRKFLRTIPTEESHIQDMVLSLALANPAIAFELTFDDRTIYNVQARHDLQTRAAMLLGRDLVQSMLSVDYERAGIHVEGLVARPGSNRTSRREQRSFLNGRAVQADVIYHAIRDAYHTLVIKGRFPPVLLFLSMDPERVDVNVHPAKREVRFHEIRLVGDVVSEAIRLALRQLVRGNTYTPGPEKSDQLRLESLPLPAPPRPAQATLPAFNLNSQVLPPAPPPRTAVPPASPAPEPVGPPVPPPPSPAASVPPPPAPQASSSPSANPLHGMRLLGQLNNTYLLAESPVGLVLIDHRAAHERILFEKLIARNQEQQGASQGLLIPVTMDLVPADAGLLSEHLPRLTELGFEIESFGANTYLISAVPVLFPQENIKRLLADVIEDLRVASSGQLRRDEQTLAAIACRAAVRAGEQLAAPEVEHLINDLAATEMPYTCPRGRPTMINISYQELDKRFGRRD